jgi:plastocyanin
LIAGSISKILKSILTRLFAATLTILLLIGEKAAQAATVQIQVGGDAPVFSPSNVSIHAGDTVQWNWAAGHQHSVTSGTNGAANGLFDSGIHSAPFSFSQTFSATGTFPYFCQPHYRFGMTGSVTVTAATTGGVLSNISTRLRVGTNNDVLIGGFVVGGTGAKPLLLRGLGPTLAQFGVSGALADPTLELRNSGGGLIISNDNWGSAANAQSIPVNMRPPNSLEPAILTSLNPGSYTAIVRGVNNTTGAALIEAYDMDTITSSHFTNISTRGLVETDSNVMIAGLIVQTNSEKVMVRALGPTLANFGVTNPLANPTLELHDANGALLASNDNWKSTQQSEITASGHAPPNDLESAIVRTLTPGNYTAIVRGVNNTTGVALVEVYTLQ